MSRFEDEGNELSYNIGQLKLTSEDGKMRLTDVADTETLFRIILSIPSPKAEPGHTRLSLAFDKVFASLIKCLTLR